MDNAVQNRLKWVDGVRLGLIRALGEDQANMNITVSTTVDPLRLIFKVVLCNPITKESRQPFRYYLRYWAAKENCELPTITIEKRVVVAELLIKHRHWSTYEQNDSGSG